MVEQIITSVVILFFDHAVYSVHNIFNMTNKLLVVNEILLFSFKYSLLDLYLLWNIDKQQQFFLTVKKPNNGND